MEYKPLHDGRPVPVLGMGTGGYGSGSQSFSVEVRAIQGGLDMGYTHIDTAEIYGGGDAERIVGEAIKGRNREALFITSKVAKDHLQRKQVLAAIDGTLQRLGTDYVDLYLIHAPDPSVPLEETFEVLNQLVEEGKTRYIGVSNFDRAQTEHALRLTQSILATNQVHYSPLVREPEQNGVLAYCQEQNIILTAYSPLEKGRIVHDDTVTEIAAKHGATPAQVSLAWLIQEPQVIVIPRSRNERHLQENLRAVDLRLDDADVAALDGLS